MTPESRVNIKDSIAAKLLKAVFAFYLAIALTVTLIHMVAEYYYMKDDINNELKDFQKTFGPSIAKALWDVNIDQILSEAEGIVEIPSIVGIIVKDEKGLVVASNGLISEEKGDIALLFSHSFKVRFKDRDKWKLAGAVTFYSSSLVVFQRVKFGFLFIIINALIKTAALWIIFLCAGRILLSRPLATLTSATNRLTFDNLEDIHIDVQTSGRNELKLLEEAFNSMIAKLHMIMTKRKQAEDEMKRLRNLLKSIIDSMPSILVGVDNSGYVTQWNLEAFQKTGISPEQAQGQLLTDIFPEVADEMEKARKTISNREPVKNNRVSFEINGKTLFSDITVYPLIAEGIEGAVIRIDDITDRIRLEEIMIQSEKVLSLGGLAAGMAHEINNPLAGILQNVQVMRNRISCGFAKNSEFAEQCGVTMESIEAYMTIREIPMMMDSIMESGMRAAEIIENTLNFSRKGKSMINAHDLGELLDKTIDLAENDYNLKTKYDFRQIKIIREYDHQLPPVPCEGTKIQQVFLNILKNGAEAMSEAKNPDMENQEYSHRFVLRIIRDEDMARIEIEDNGPGMREDVKKRIFEPFFSKKSYGTGLGLSVSYFIITENHNGKMAVESTIDKGSKFIIHLPLESGE